MTPSLKISQKVINRLCQTKSNNSGRVYGIVSKNSLIVLELQVDIDNGDNTILNNSFPAEIYECGVFNIGDGTFDESSIKNRLTEVYVTDNPIFINCNSENNEIRNYFFINGQLESAVFKPITEQEILSQYIHLHLVAEVPLTCDLTAACIKESFINLRKVICSGVMTFGFTKSNIYLLGADNENGVIGVNGNTTVSELSAEANDLAEGNTKKKKSQQYGVDVLTVTMLKKMTVENGLGGNEHAPLCVLDKKQCKTLNMKVPIDALAILPRQMKMSNVYEIIVESAVRNLRLLENTILQSIESSSQKLSHPEVFHFFPEDCDHFITAIYFKNDSEDDLLAERQKYHKQFLMNEDRPIFRRANRFMFRSGNPSGEPLINPHATVKPTDNGGKIALVKGKYSYYHYCQNKMDDNGWGCAYRSLQTLASWFNLQGYTDREVPTFKDIQKCLVDIGDKPESFIGSRQWIGSTEVNFVLNTLLGVTSKILYVSSGEEMGSKGPELVSHFETQGTPVMIGGGVLAHTILGVDYNSQTGSLRFLILDPHYTGGEDLLTIQNKGWCGWKNVDFWDKTAYYNMCLPQVPKSI